MTAPGTIPPPAPGWWAVRNRLIEPAAATLILTGSAPMIGAAIVIQPTAATLTLTGSIPIVKGVVPPVFVSVGSDLVFSNSTAANIPVPAGVTGASGEIVLAFMYVEVTQAVTPPAGFTEAISSPVTCTGVWANYLRVFWKRPTIADSGTYNFTVAAGLTGRAGFAALFTGCVISGNPIGMVNTAFETDASPTDGNTPAVIINPTSGPNRLLVWAITDFSGSSNTTFPGGFTKRGDIEVAMATLVQATAGSTGSLVATTTSTTTRSGAWLGELLPT